MNQRPILIEIDGELVNAHEIPGATHQWNNRGTATVTAHGTGETFDITPDHRGVVAVVSNPSDPRATTHPPRDEASER